MAQTEFQGFFRQYWWILILVIVGGMLICLLVTPAGTFILGIFIPPTPTETSTETTENNPDDSNIIYETPTETETENNPENSDITFETDQPTEPPTNTPTKTVVPIDITETQGPTETETQTACVVNPNDGFCDLRCENTDLDSNNCVCNNDDICGVGEGFNCSDCSYGQCGNACGSDADCHNPALYCNAGQCDGASCGPTCVMKADCSNCVYGYPMSWVICSDGSLAPEPACSCAG